MLPYLLFHHLLFQFVNVALFHVKFLTSHVAYVIPHVIPEVALGDVSTHQKSWHICFLAFFVMSKRKAKNPFGLD